MAPECVLTTIKAVTDPEGRERWVPMAVWSGALTVHGLVSLIVRGLAFERRDELDSSALVVPVIDTPEGPVPGVTLGGLF